MSRFDGVTRRISGIARRSIGGDKAEEDLNVGGAKGTNATSHIAAGVCRDAPDRAENLREDAWGNGDENNGSDACIFTAAAGAALTTQDSMLESSTTPETTVPIVTTTTTTEIMDSQEDGAGSMSLSNPERRPTGFAGLRLHSAKKRVSTNEDNIPSSSISRSTVCREINQQCLARRGTVGKKGGSESGVSSKDMAGRERRGEEINNTVAAKIGGVLTALPLSKLKIVIGKQINCLPSARVRQRWRLSPGIIRHVWI